MRLFYLASIVLLQCSQLWADECDKLLGHLGDTQQRFVYCATTKAVPVQLCIGCQPEHKNMVDSYDKFVNDKNCSTKFFDHDRINLISTTQSILVGLWTKAYCDNCNNSSVFEAKCKALKSCLDDHAQIGDGCKECLSKYLDLNDYYKEWEQSSTGKICFDAQDSMNITRKHWSKDLHCCQRVFNMTLFLSISSIILVLPIVFYASLYAYGKRRERIHDVLNNEDAETTSTPAVPISTPSALPIQNDNNPSTSNIRQNFKSKNKFQSQVVTTDSSSEESDFNDGAKNFKSLNQKKIS